MTSIFTGQPKIYNTKYEKIEKFYTHILIKFENFQWHVSFVLQSILSKHILQENVKFVWQPDYCVVKNVLEKVLWAEMWISIRE